MNIFQELKERKVLDKDGKVDALGPYGKSKLTGQEVAQYFKKHKVKDKKIRKAVEVALDLGGAMSVAQKEIKKFFGNSVLKNKDVQKALKYANESFEMNQLVGMLHEHVLNLTEKNLMPAIQKIVDTKGAAKVGGVMIDMFTASMIAQIYDKVNDQNKKKMEKAKVEMLVKIAQKMMQKMEYNPLEEGRAMKPKQIAKKYKREIEQLAKKGQSPTMGKHKVYMALYNLAWENGDIRGDDPDEADEVIDDYMDDIMGEFFAHIKEGFKSDAQRRAAFASGYKAKGKKDKKEEVETLDEKSKDVRKRYRGKEQKSVNSLIMQNGVDKIQKLFDDEPKEFDALIGRLAKLESVEHDEIVLGEAGMGDKIGKLFRTKDKKEIDGIANLMNMTSVKVLQAMMKQNPKGFKRMAKKMGELPAMEEVQESVEKTTEKLVERNMLGRLAKQLKLNEEGKQKMFTYFEKGELNQ